MAYVDDSMIPLLQQLGLMGGQSQPYHRPFAMQDSLPMSMSLQQQPSQFFDNQAMNMVYNMAAPALVSKLSGGAQVTQLPQYTTGIGAYNAMYAHKVSSPMYEAMSSTLYQQVGMGLGRDIADTAINAGYVPDGMTPEEFRLRAENMGGTPAAQLVSQMITGLEPVQAVMGGNPLDLVSKLGPRMNRLSRRGDALVDHMNMTAQQASGENTGDFIAELYRASHADANGDASFLPNQKFSRGYDTGEIANVAASMIDNNYSYDGKSMRGMSSSNEEKVAMVGEQLRLLNAVGEALQSENVGEQLATLDKMTAGMGGKIDPAVLRGSLDKISATAHILGISSKDMMDGMERTQDFLKQAGPDMGRMVVAQMLEEDNAAIAALTDRPLKDVELEQAQLVFMGANAQEGKMSRLIGYMNQTGDVSADLFTEYDKAARSGNMAQRLAAEEAIFREGTGVADWDDALRKVNTPGFIEAIGAKSNDDTVRDSLGRTRAIQSNELNERAFNVSSSAARRKIDIMQEMMGAPRVSWDDPETAKERTDAVIAALNGAGAGVLADVVQSQWDAGSDPTESIHNVHDVMQGKAFDKYRGLIDAENRETLRNIKIDEYNTGESRRKVALQSHIDTMYGMSSVTDKKAFTDVLYKADAALYAGDTAEAARLLQSIYGDLNDADAAYIEAAANNELAVFNGIGKTIALGEDGAPSGITQATVIARNNLHTVDKDGNWVNLAAGINDEYATQEARDVVSAKASDLAINIDQIREAESGVDQNPVIGLLKAAQGDNTVAEGMGLRVEQYTGPRRSDVMEQYTGPRRADMLEPQPAQMLEEAKDASATAPGKDGKEPVQLTGTVVLKDSGGGTAGMLSFEDAEMS